MRIFALTFGGQESASTHYRLFQYGDLLAADGIEFEWAEMRGFSDYGRLADFDVVILQKTIVSGSKLRKIRRQAKRLVYDADDRIWLRPLKEHHWFTRWRIDRRMRRIARHADLCIAANRVIGDDIEAYGGNLAVIPMAVDTSVWHDCSADGGKVVVGWSGAPKNTEFLRELAAELRRVQREFAQVEFRFHSGRDPAIEGLTYTHIPYRQGGESDALCGFDIGLLPLPDDSFAAGKSPIKSLQYMASGASVLVSPVGAVREIVLDGYNGLYVSDWASAIRRLLEDPALREHLAENARMFIREKHELGVVYGRWRDAILGLLSTGRNV